ncbi:MAG: CDP-alcohol phosphatidyltransferase family protein, partial [Actinomycetota bacterium]|nr:CDP-alcohol phosphatidyltransferase family protein [Actinomycetota bacterium]
AGGPTGGPAAGPAEAGGFLDIVCDFTVYGATVVGVAIGVGVDTGVAAWPFLAVLGVYYVNGTAFLAFSSLAERSGRRLDDGRSLSFIGGLAEGTETVVVHALWMLLPGIAAPIAWVWAVVVGLGAAQRVWTGYRLLR